MVYLYPEFHNFTAHCSCGARTLTSENVYRISIEALVHPTTYTCAIGLQSSSSDVDFIFSLLAKPKATRSSHNHTSIRKNRTYVRKLTDKWIWMCWDTFRFRNKEELVSTQWSLLDRARLQTTSAIVSRRTIGDLGTQWSKGKGVRIPWRQDPIQWRHAASARRWTSTEIASFAISIWPPTYFIERRYRS